MRLISRSAASRPRGLYPHQLKTLRAYRGFIRRNIRPCKKVKELKFFDVGPLAKRSDQAGLERETNPYILTDTRPCISPFWNCGTWEVVALYNLGMDGID